MEVGFDADYHVWRGPRGHTRPGEGAGIRTANRSDRADVTVRGDHDQGARLCCNQSASAFKTTEPLINIPQLDTVISQDLIKDIGSVNTTDIVSYFGLTSGYANSENMKLRGNIITYAYVDETTTNSIFEDNCWVDTYEIIKGPAEILYLNSSLNGVVLKSTKKPLPYKQNIVTASINSNGLIRTTFDSTAPLGTLGDAKISYRAVGSLQRGGVYFTNMSQDSECLYTMLQADIKGSTIRVSYTWEKMWTEQMWGLVTPGGDLWTGQGWKNSANMVPNDMEHFNHQRYMGEVFTRIGDSWENKVKMGVWSMQRAADPGSLVYMASYDWANKTMTYNAREDVFRYAHWCFIDDMMGHYNIGPFKNISVLGGGYDEYTIRQMLLPATQLPPGQWSNPTVSMYSSQQVNSIIAPTWQQYDAARAQGLYPNLGVHNTTPVYNLFGSQMIEIIPDRLILTGGWSYTGIVPTTVSNLSTLPWTATLMPTQEWLHRYGITFKPMKDLALFALESTNFAPATQGALLPTDSWRRRCQARTTSSDSRPRSSEANFRWISPISR